VSDIELSGFHHHQAESNLHLAGEMADKYKAGDYSFPYNIRIF